MTLLDVMYGMTLTFVLYICAFTSAKKSFLVHVIFACLAFFLDMWLTFVMVNLREGVALGAAPFSVIFHVIFSVVAIILFFLQAALGIAARRRPNYRGHHINFAKVFLATWTVSFLSGFALFFL